LRALIIKKPWLDKILAGTKTWEIRGSRTNIRGTIGLIESRSGTVVGLCEVVDCVGPLTADEYRRNSRRAGMLPAEANLGGYKNTFAWVLANARRFKTPGSYRHPSGAVIWVTLDEATERAVKRRKTE
jgi:ASCH domain